jgi:hypothetical protein
MRTVNLTGRTSWAVRALVGSLAVLLPAGVWAAAGVNRGQPTTIAAGGRAGATGLVSVLVDEDGAPGLAAVVTVTPATVVSTTTPAPATPTTTTRPTTRSTTTTKPPATTGATVTLPPGVPWPSMPPATGIPNIPAGSAWENHNAGVTARLRIEPTAPVAGQAVTFFIDYASAEPCCTVMVDFGDGSGYSLNNGVSCGELSPGPHKAVTTHIYAAAGAYKPTLGVIAALPCTSLVGPGAPNPPEIHGTQVTGCIGVGPGPAAQKGCTPFPPFAPDQLVSPVIDPFCQVRSDCTKASTPRPGWDT